MCTHLKLQDRLARNGQNHGAMLVTIILGADKTTVSIATGHTKYHPVYLSLGNLDNSMRRGHRDSVIPIAFLAIPKCEPRPSLSLSSIFTERFLFLAE
jgi:hypothetical protein